MSDRQGDDVDGEVYQFRCEWCDLPRKECCCDSPDFSEYSRCGSCGTWKPVRELEIRDEEETVEYSGCKGGCIA